VIVSEKHSKETDLILRTAKSLSRAIHNESKLDNEKLRLVPGGLCGFSGWSFRNFMNNMGEIKNLKYLEVGSYCGSTLIPLLYKNISNIHSAYAIDNWSEFNEFGDPRTTFYYNLNYFFEGDLEKLTVIEDDCFSFDKNIIKEKIDFYFYDGPHSEEDHYNAYIYYDDLLADVFVTVVDDWNSERVKQGTKKAFKTLDYEVLASWEILTDDLPGWSENPDSNWWRGAYIAIIKKQKGKNK